MTQENGQEINTATKIETAGLVGLPETIKRLTDEKLKTFVNDFLSHKIFSTMHLNQNEKHMLPHIFLPIALGMLVGASEEFIKSIGIIYEYISESGPIAINGFPIFLSCRLMHKDDWEIALATIKSEFAKRENISLVK